MSGGTGGDGGPLGLLVDLAKAFFEYRSARVLLAAFMVGGGATVGTKLGAPDRYTGHDAAADRAESNIRFERQAWKLQRLEASLEKCIQAQKRDEDRLDALQSQADRNSACCEFWRE